MGDSLISVPGKQALSSCVNLKPGLILMKKAEVFVFASAGGACFEYVSLKSRRVAFSVMPLGVVKTLT